MAYSKEQIETTFNSICEDIEQGYSLRTVLKNGDNPSSQTFYKWLDSDETKSKRYARACEKRAESIFEDVLEIADESKGDTITDKDGNTRFDGEFAARSKIRIDARKWMLGKLQPEKYGDTTKVNLSGDLEININFED